MPAQKLDTLTGLRFFAAIAILIHHLRGFGLPKEVLEGWALDNGVAFFFVLSGFILAYVYPSLDTPCRRPALLRRPVCSYLARPYGGVGPVLPAARG